ncbi:MAG TPA: DegQ family serine endoprotease [Paracoccaceae bacterium]|nr:DegQ family serine endoprotease [Paracoccaceae bacterium]
MSAASSIFRPPAARRTALAGLAAGLILWSPLAEAAEPQGSIADLVERVSPAVVTVLSTRFVNPEERFGALPGLPFPPGSPFEEFFRRFGTPEGRPMPQQGLGSGFVIDSAGYIITNNHVIDDAGKVRVRLKDAREFEAEVVGTDPMTDIALLKIEARDLPTLTFGDSDKLRVGEDVIAVGNPFGFGGTVTRGIVSALGRDIAAGPYVDFIQTDAAINRGNSGGPLFNMAGEVIGVNSAIFSPTGGSVGLGFAIPSNLVKQIAAELKNDGKVDRGWLGVSIQPVTPDIAAALGLDAARGALVADVVPESPSRGILRPGDVILRYDGKHVATSRDLPKLVGATPSGREVEIEILRDGRTRTVEVTVGELERPQRIAGSQEERMPAAERLGVTLAPVTPEIAGRLGEGRPHRGAVVTSLKADGAAALAGLEVGDIILRVGDTEVRSPADVVAALEQTERDAALLLVDRDGDQIFVAVRLTS